MTLPNPPETARAKRRYGGESGEERSRQRRERLLEAALEVFGTLGYNKATMRDICAQARLAERYFYENFSSLDDTFRAVFDQLDEQLLAAIAQAMADAPMESRAKGKAGLKAFFEFIKADPRRGQIMLLDVHQVGYRTLQGGSPVVRAYEQIMRSTAEALHPGLPPHINLDLIASGLVGMIVKTCVTWMDSDFKDSVETMIEHNLYAWRGLDRWFNRLRSAAGSPAPDEAAAAAAVAARTAALPRF